MDFSGRGYRYKCWPPGVMLSPDKLYSGSAGAGALLGRCHVLAIGANDTDAPSSHGCWSFGGYGERGLLTRQVNVRSGQCRGADAPGPNVIMQKADSGLKLYSAENDPPKREA